MSLVVALCALCLVGLAVYGLHTLWLIVLYLRSTDQATAADAPLLAGTSGDVHLTCPAELASYYRRFGFQVVDWADLPLALKLKFGLGQLLSLLPGVSIVSMHKTPPD